MKVFRLSSFPGHLPKADITLASVRGPSCGQPNLLAIMCKIPESPHMTAGLSVSLRTSIAACHVFILETGGIAPPIEAHSQQHPDSWFTFTKKVRSPNVSDALASLSAMRPLIQ